MLVTRGTQEFFCGGPESRFDNDNDNEHNGF